MSNLFDKSPFLERIGTTKDGIPRYRSKLTTRKSIAEILDKGNKSNLPGHSDALHGKTRIQSPIKEQTGM